MIECGSVLGIFFPLSLVLSHQNAEYIELTAKLLDAKENAAFAKEEGNKTMQKVLSTNIRTFRQREFQLSVYFVMFFRQHAVLKSMW